MRKITAKVLLIAIVATGLVLGVAVAAHAHHPVLDIEYRCNTATGKFDGTVTVQSDRDWNKDWTLVSYSSNVTLTGFVVDDPVTTTVEEGVRDDQVPFVATFSGLSSSTTVEVTVTNRWHRKGNRNKDVAGPATRSISETVTGTCTTPTPPVPPTPPTPPVPPTPPTPEPPTPQPPTPPAPPAPPSPPDEPKPAKWNPGIGIYLGCEMSAVIADNRRSKDGEAERATVRYRWTVKSGRGKVEAQKTIKVRAGDRKVVDVPASLGDRVRIRALGFPDLVKRGRMPLRCGPGGGSE